MRGILLLGWLASIPLLVAIAIVRAHERYRRWDRWADAVLRELSTSRSPGSTIGKRSR